MKSLPSKRPMLQPLDYHFHHASDLKMFEEEYKKGIGNEKPHEFEERLLKAYDFPRAEVNDVPPRARGM